MGSGRLRNYARFTGVLLSFLILTMALVRTTGVVFAAFGDPTLSDDVDRWTDNTYTSTQIFPFIAADPDADGTPGIDQVQFRVDGGAWTPCTAEDGAFDSADENVLCTVTSLSVGSVDVEVVATDVDTNDSTIYGPFPAQRINLTNNEIMHYPLDDSTDFVENYGLSSYGIPIDDPGDYSDDATGIGGAVAFANNASVEIPDVNSRYSFSGASAEFMVEAYVKKADFSAAGATQVVVAKSDGASDELWFMGVDSAGGIICSVYTDGYQYFETGLLGSPMTLTDNTWNKIACSYDSATGTLRAFLDDVEVHSQVLVGETSIPASNKPLYLNGFAPSGDAGFNGSIDELKIYNVATLDTTAPSVFLSDFNGISKTTKTSNVIQGIYAEDDVEVDTVEWHVVGSGDAWASCTIASGAFVVDAWKTEALCTIPTISVGVNNLEFRATDTSANTTSGGDIFTTTIERVAIPVAAPVFYTAMDDYTDLLQTSTYMPSYATEFSISGNVATASSDFSGAVTFSSNGYLSYADPNSELDFASSSASFRAEAYVKDDNFDEGDSYRVVAGKGNTADDDYSWFMGIDASGGLLCLVNTDGWHFTETSFDGTPEALTNNAWNKISCTYDASTGELSAYINDVLSSSITIDSGSREIPASTGALYVNGKSALQPVFNDTIDELKIYNTEEPAPEGTITVTMTDTTQLLTTAGNFTFTGTAAGPNTVASVEWSAHDADSWTNCTADDSTFDEVSDAFTCTIATSGDGTDYYDIRSTDSSAVVSDIVVVGAMLDEAHLIDYWFSFDNTTDAGRNAGESRVAGDVTAVGSPSVVSGVVDSAITFNGNSAFEFADPDAHLDSSGSSANFSVTLSIKPNTSMLGNPGTLIQKLNEAGDGIQWQVIVDSEGRVYLQQYVNGNDLSVGQSSDRTLLTMDAWNTVTVAWDFAHRVASVKVNSNLAETAVWTYSGTQSSSTGNVYIGDSSTSDQGYIGEIDNIIFYRVGDAAPPQVTIDTLPDSSRETDNTPSFELAFSDATGVASAEYLFSVSSIGNLDDEDWTSITSPDDAAWGGVSENYTVTAPTALADGNWTLYIRSVDSVGHQSLYSRGGGQQWQHYNVTSAYVMPFYSFVIEAVDTTRPRIYANAVTPDPTTDTAPAIRGYVKDYSIENTGDTASNITQISYSIDDGEFIEVDPVDGTYNATREDFYFQISMELTDGSHTLKIRAVDASGNTTADGTAGEEFGDKVLTFAVSTDSVVNESQEVVKDITFDDHDLQDTIFSTAVWGNGIVRLRQAIEFNSTLDYTPPDHDEFGYTYGEVSIGIHEASDGNAWIATHNGGLFYYNLTSKEATRYDAVTGRVSGVFDFEEGGNRYLAINRDDGLSTLIYDINNTPEDTGDDPAPVSYGDKAGFDEYRRTGFNAVDTRGSNLALYGVFSGTTDAVIRVDLEGTPMDLSDDSYVVWGHDENLGDNLSDVFAADFTSFYFDQTAHMFIAGSYTKGIFVCDDNDTPTNKADDECAAPFGYTAGSHQGRIFSIIKDPNGWYWLGGDNGLARVDLNGTADMADDDFVAVIPSATIGNERIADIAWVAGVTPVGDEVWALTREGRLRAIEYNFTYDDSLDDTTYSYKIPQFEYQSGGATTFFMKDRNTIYNVVAGQGIVKTDLTRDYETTNVIEIYPEPPLGLLEVDNVSLDEIVGSVSAGSIHTFDELISYEISNDAGVTWRDLDVGSTINFTTSDYKLKLRITLHKGSTPIIESLRLIYTAQPKGTIASANSGSSGSSGSSTSSSSSTSCSEAVPGSKAPHLYAAVPFDEESILLYFTDADDPVDRYVLEYGTRSGQTEWGSLNIGGRGTRTYKVGGLSPNTTYYFRVRGGNGCAVGPWSNELSSTTRRSYAAASIENLITRVDANMTDDVSTSVPSWSPDAVSPDTMKQVGAVVAKKTTKGFFANFFDNVLELPWLWIAAGLAVIVMLLWLLGAAKRRKKRQELPLANTVLPDVPQYFTTH